MRRIFLALPLLIAPSVVMAHTGHGAGLFAGLTHPFTGIDHVLAMVGVGLWAALLGGRARLALPGAFLAAMALGGALAMTVGVGGSAVAVEPAIMASVIVLGAAVAFALRVPLVLALPLVAMFGLAHGAAHGAEVAGDGLGFGVAMLLATALLHGVGVALGLLLPRSPVRTFGSATALVGLALALG